MTKEVKDSEFKVTLITEDMTPKQRQEAERKAKERRDYLNKIMRGDA